MDTVTVLEQRPMERDWTERKFFSDAPDWLKEAMACDAISPVDGSDPQEWMVGYYADGERKRVAPGDSIDAKPVFTHTKDSGYRLMGHAPQARKA